MADIGVLGEIAGELGLDSYRFEKLISDPETREAVEGDRQLARRLQVRTVPSLIVRETGTRLVNGPLDDLRAQLRAALKLAH